MRGRELAAGLRRLAVLVAGTAVATAIASLVFGLLLHAELRRALAIGFYAVGSLFVVIGFFYGTRPPVRTTGGGGGGPGPLGSLAAGGGSARWADRHDVEDSLSASAVFVVTGLVLVAVGVVCDPRTRLV
jgi:hypothetical protein